MFNKGQLSEIHKVALSGDIKKLNKLKKNMPSAEFSKLINLEIDVKGQTGFQPSLTGQGQGAAIEKTISPTPLMIAIVKNG